jgi:hypothetical protein
MLVALGDKPARRAHRVCTQPAMVQKAAQTAVRSAKTEATLVRPRATAHTEQAKPGQTPAVPVQTVPDSAHTNATPADADLASELIALSVTTQPVETVIAVLVAVRNGASINAAAKASRINYRTAQRIVQAVGEHRERELASAS